MNPDGSASIFVDRASEPAEEFRLPSLLPVYQTRQCAQFVLVRLVVRP
jgi:hypothetical protein